MANGRPMFKVLPSGVKTELTVTPMSDQGGFVAGPSGAGADPSLASSPAHLNGGPAPHPPHSLVAGNIVRTNGQVILVQSRPPAPGAQPLSHSTNFGTHVRPSPTNPAYPPQPQPQQPQPPPPQPPQSQSGLDGNANKCLSFLRTLVKLSAKDGESTPTHRSVVRLVQDLVAGSMSPEDFTQGVQRELKSSAQPHLNPFLHRALPSLRNAVRLNQAQIEGVSLFVPLHSQAPPRPPQPPPPQPQHPQQQPQPPVPLHGYAQPSRLATPSPTPSSLQHSSPHTPSPGNPHPRPPYNLRPQAPNTSMASSLSMSLGSSPSKLSHTSANSTPQRPGTSATVREDDDLNDVAAMGGVNLVEESRALALATVAPLESRGLGGAAAEAEEELSRWLSIPAIRARVTEKANLGLSRPASILLALALQRRLKDWLERLALFSQHRAENLRRSAAYGPGPDIRAQLRWLDEVDRAEGARREERDKEFLLKLSKSKSSGSGGGGGRLEEGETERLKAKAKELQKLEEEQNRNRCANQAASLALNSSRKRAWDTAQASASPGLPTTSSTSASQPSQSQPPQAETEASLLRTLPPASMSAPASARVSIKDLQWLVSEMGDARASRVLYRHLLKPIPPQPPD